MSRVRFACLVAGALLLLGLTGSSALAETGAAPPHHTAPPPDIQSNIWLNVIEIVTGLAASLMALQATLAYRAGRLGRGMQWVTLGMVIMAIGHIILVVRRIASFDVFGFLGQGGSFVAFSIAVFASFVSSAFGFWLIRHQAPFYDSGSGQSSTQRRTGVTPTPPRT